MLTKTLKLSVWNGDPNCTIFCLLYFFRPNPAFLSIFENLQCLHFSPANRLFAISDTIEMEWTNVALCVFYLCGFVYNYNCLFSISVDYVGTGIHQARRSYSRNMGFRMVDSTCMLQQWQTTWESLPWGTIHPVETFNESWRIWKPCAQTGRPSWFHSSAFICFLLIKFRWQKCVIHSGKIVPPTKEVWKYGRTRRRSQKKKSWMTRGGKGNRHNSG